MARISELAATRTRQSAELLMALGSGKTYLNRFAVEALGGFSGESSEAAAAYLQRKLKDKDAQIVCAAIRALGKLDPAKAAPALDQVLNDNRRRPDGYGERIRITAIDVLGAAGTGPAVRLLLREMGTCTGKSVDLEYGSAILGALVKYDTESGRAAAAAYAGRLKANLPGTGAPRENFEVKIKEATAVSEGRGFAGMNQ